MSVSLGIDVVQELPLTALEKARTERLSQILRDALSAEPTGSLPFSQWMDAALYHPEFGYYMQPEGVFGREGDFTTAPELTPHFGACVATTVAPQLRALGSTAELLEVGAGRGRLAVPLIQALERSQTAWSRYLILEKSPAGVSIQQQYLREHLPESCFKKIEWISQWPVSPWCGVVLANEVLDALAVDCWGWDEERQALCEWRVGWNNQWEWQSHPLVDEAFEAELRSTILPSIGEAAHIRRTEWHRSLKPFLSAIDAFLTRGAVWLADYGWSQEEYYDVRRPWGTLRAFYRHRCWEEVLRCPGVMDLTASVNWTVVRQYAEEQKWRLEGFNTQAWYLLSTGLIERIESQKENTDVVAWFNQQQALKQLLMPQEMGATVLVGWWIKEG